MMILLRIYYIDDYDVGHLGMTFDDDAGDYVVDKKFQWIWLWYIMLNRIFDGGDVMLIMNLSHDYDDYVFPPLQASCGCLAQGNAQSGAHSCAELSEKEQYIIRIQKE